MDIVSHGLWTNVIFLTARRRDRWWAVAFALLPDLIPFGPFFFEELATHGIGNGPPQFTPEVYAYIWGAYQFTHSLVVFGAVFLAVAFWRKVFHPSRAEVHLEKSETQSPKSKTNPNDQKDTILNFEFWTLSLPLRPWWALGAWGLHILTDIPTHRRAFFPTPFLWPFSNYTVDAISWANPWFFFANLVALAVVYVVLGLYWIRRRRFART